MAYSRQRVSKVSSKVAPLGGLNDSDPLATMEAKYCYQMDDWFPSTLSLISRSGYRLWSDGMEGIKTLVKVAPPSGEERLLAFTNGNIYDLTESVENPTPVHEITSGSVSHTHYANLSGSYLVYCNQASDPATLYNPTDGVFTSFTESVTPTLPGEISGVSPEVLSIVHEHQGRLWFVEHDTMTAWYLPIDALAGEMNPFYMGGIFRRGGHISDISTWSYDSGSGMDDMLVIRSSEGEVAIYRGTDPDDATKWQLSSIYYVADPVGVRSTADLGGDLIMLTRAGLVPLSKIVSGVATEALYETTLTRTINRTLVARWNIEGGSRDWEVHNIVSLQAILILIPPVGDLPAVQFLMNVLTGAWTRYNLPMTTLTIYKDLAFFGDVDGNVWEYGGYRLDRVARDGSGGVPIQCSFSSAFDYFDSPGVLKSFTMFRPIFQTHNVVPFLSKLNVDYTLAPLIEDPPVPTEEVTGSQWDDATWDFNKWSGGTFIYRPWTSVVGLGFCASLQIKVNTSQIVSMAALEMVYEDASSI